MPFTSLVIWLKNSELFMKVIIRVIYRSHHHTHSPMSLCCAVLGQTKENKKPSLQQNHPLVYLGQSANSQELLSLEQRRRQTAWLEIQGPYALQLCDKVSVLI